MTFPSQTDKKDKYPPFIFQLFTLKHCLLEIRGVRLVTIGLDAELRRDHLSLRIINYPERWTNLCNHQLGDHKHCFQRELENFNEV